MNQNKYIWWFLWLTTLFTALLIWFPIEHQIHEIFRIIIWSIFLLFFPWFFITETFFKKWEIDILEKWALSFAFSISILPLLTFYFNLIGVKITDKNVFFIACGVILLCILLQFLFSKKSKSWNHHS